MRPGGSKTLLKPLLPAIAIALAAAVLGAFFIWGRDSASQTAPGSPSPSTQEVSMVMLPDSSPVPTPDDMFYNAPAGGLEAPHIIVYKTLHRLDLFDGDMHIGRFRIGLGASWDAGDKQKEGDGRTPEGEFYICTRNAQSSFYLSLGLSYPNAEDAHRGLADGIIDETTAQRIIDAIDSGLQPPWYTPLGGEIMIHGRGGDRDWTAGCIAVDDDVMDILWQHVPIGTAVRIQE